MGLDAAHLAATLAKAREVERSPSAIQRASEIAQEQLAGESAAILHTKKTDAATELERQKIRQERERRRREIERRTAEDESSDDSPGGPSLDVVA
jgi:hypothetical protein